MFYYLFDDFFWAGVGDPTTIVVCVGVGGVLSCGM